MTDPIVPIQPAHVRTGIVEPIVTSTVPSGDDDPLEILFPRFKREVLLFFRNEGEAAAIVAIPTSARLDGLPADDRVFAVPAGETRAVKVNEVIAGWPTDDGQRAARVWADGAGLAVAAIVL